MTWWCRNCALEADENYCGACGMTLRTLSEPEPSGREAGVASVPPPAKDDADTSPAAVIRGHRPSEFGESGASGSLRVGARNER